MQMRVALAERHWDAFAPWMCAEVFSAALAHQRRRYDSAVLLGLVDDEGCRDITAGQMRIDRTLAALMAAEDVDIHAVARELLATDQFEDFGADHVADVSDVGGTCFATHTAVGPTIITSWLELEAFRYDGIDIDLVETLPEAIVSAAIGRRLGDVVGTGDLRIGWRRIVSARTRDPRGAIPALTGFPWRTSFRLEPDLIGIAEFRSG